MANIKNKNKNKNKSKAKPVAKVATSEPLTLSDLRKNEKLWYKILLLIYDFHHQKQETSKRRTDEILDPIYIGTPYFTFEEAESIKMARVDHSRSSATPQTLEELIQATLQERQATTLTAIFPCGPHDMVPVYLECFGIDKAEITDAKFVLRVARYGLELN